MAQWQERAALLFKNEGLEKLKKANVLVVGLGGVGSFAAEFSVRAGIGNMTIVDGDSIDTVSYTHLDVYKRQLLTNLFDSQNIQ